MYVHTCAHTQIYYKELTHVILSKLTDYSGVGKLENQKSDGVAPF